MVIIYKNKDQEPIMVETSKVIVVKDPVDFHITLEPDGLIIEKLNTYDNEIESFKEESNKIRLK